MNPISFMSANYVARQLDYHMTGDWDQGEQATNEYFAPLDTFRPRFADLLQEIKSLGFDHLDLWLPHLNPKWATPDHIAIAQELLEAYGLPVVTLAGSMGSTLAEVKAICELALALEVPVMGGVCPALDEDRGAVISLVKGSGLKLALENHPEKTPEAMLAKLGNGGEVTLGTVVDTGWYGTHGYDAAQAIRVLGQSVFHVHLKDVRAAGAHDNCRYGEGVVPVRRCVEALLEIGYQGAISVELEAELFNPNEDVAASRLMLEGWLEKAI